MVFELWIMCGIILLCVILSAFFSGSETALTAASRARMHSLENQGDERAEVVQQLISRRDRLIGALLIGNNLANILASSIATSIFLTFFGDAGVAYATIAMTIILVIFAEVLPKSWAISAPDRFSLAVARSVSFVVTVIGPVSSVVNWIVRVILRLFGINLAAGRSMLSASEEIRGAVAVLHRDGSVIKEDRDQLGGLLDLKELEVSDIMVHRTAMGTINADAPAEQIVGDILASPHTRMPVWRNDIDNIVGIIHTKDLVRALYDVDNDFTRIDIMKVASKPWFVPDTTTLQDQLNAFLRRKAHIAIVVDEYGDVQGLVTLEDILEEIVGDIADEHDIDMQGVRLQPDGSVIVDGSLPIRDLNRALDWSLPDEEATTIAGLVIHETQSIPEVKQAFTFHGKRFSVLKKEKNRLTRLRIVTLDADGKPVVAVGVLPQRT
ncbi:HlyC/CorC family transporter [Ochrobactrum soli]|uniref:Co2 transporter containing CBS domains n=2 Tax=Ochrobactrum TaxID=528 RepID=A0A2P9HRD2_9HYPH|nr:MULTISPECIES: HlyC/CorC family transporter [Brucella]MCI0998509.1 HlyC/CorC family transporter [Ochrobactrum sp. C6C9]RRD27589.1 HlyC/CorC family transporter [Brucellaceae bacterium VT-16-1752]WHT41562.1 HlyC/CorC family transporter [Ochrobactrum sp. SSR]MDX4075267.1 HlyC/CorC family transporter [Brucella sp. NBRC 113783]NNU59292.1 HlyC/CorC family transporter [[Ochrobactrum] soli]